MFKFRGKVVSKKTISGISNATGNPWTNCEYTIEVHDNESKELVVMKSFGAVMDQAQEGDYVEGGFTLSSSEYKERRYNEIKIQFLNPVDTSNSFNTSPAPSGRPEPQYQGSNTNNAFLPDDSKDDLPF